ncbi:MAG: hypothetical protein KAH57_11435 [Thermoplasmata archaeon]|nr:hypothetical protein [Thermoplasmata archaeon]
MTNDKIPELDRMELLKESWKAIKENGRAIFTLFLILYLPLDLLIYSAYFIIYGPSKEIEIASYIPLIVIMLFGMVYLFLFGTLIRIALIYIINQYHVSENRVAVAEALDFARKRWLDGIKTMALKGIYLLPLYLALIIPGLVYSYYWSLTLQSVALRNACGKDAMDHSRSLMKGHFSKILHVLLPVIIVAIILSYLDNILLMTLGIIGVQVPYLWGNLIGTILSRIGGVIILIALTTLFIGINKYIGNQIRE